MIPDYSRQASTHEIELGGCALVPLAAYLKALGILRLVSEQADSGARGCWRDDRFVLFSNLDAAALERFFLEEYRPTPLVAPWGARSGFYPGSSESAARAALETIESSPVARLARFRTAIGSVRVLLLRRGFTDKVKDEAKLELLRACRAELPEDLLPWLDACYVLTEEDRAFPPLLGTGGNEGSGSYVSGFAQLVVACLVKRAHDHALRPALFGAPTPDAASGQTPGQFAPLAGGGPNAGAGFGAGPALNPWDFLMCLEGTLVFAAAVTRRLDSSSPDALAFPFTVRAVGAGSGTVALGDEPHARAETWFPLWGQPASLTELRTILAEGRVQINGRTAGDALDFARATCALGVERGISAFLRYGYLQRFGRSVIAVPIDRVVVRRSVPGDLLRDLDEEERWLETLRRAARKKQPEAPARLKLLVRRLEDALFELTAGRTSESARIQTVLIRLGEVQSYLGSSPSMREAVRTPVPELREEWVRRGNDDTAEFRLATALAGIHGAREENGRTECILPMWMHLWPIDSRRRWLKEAGYAVCPPSSTLDGMLVSIAHRRVLRAVREGVTDRAWSWWCAAAPQDVVALLNDDVDTDRIAALIKGLVLCRIPQLDCSADTSVVLPPSYAVLKPYFTNLQQLRAALKQNEDPLITAISDGNDQDSMASGVREAAAVARLLSADRVADAVCIGVRRLRALDAAPIANFTHTAHPDGKRLLASLLVPISTGALRMVIQRIKAVDIPNNRQVTRDTEE